MENKAVKVIKEVVGEVKDALGQIFFEIEYEVFPLRAIYFANVEAKTEEEALQKFWKEHPRAIVRSVNDIRKEPELRNPNLS